MSHEESRGALAFVVESEYILRVAAGPRPTPVVLALHGQGETAAAFARTLRPAEVPGASFLYPGAPLPVEIRREDGTRRIGQTWYCYDGDQERFHDALEEDEGHLDAILARVGKDSRLDPGRLVVVGYSQGAYAAGFFALRRKPRPLGLALLSGRLKHEFLEGSLAAVAGLPVLVATGKDDRAIPREALDAGIRLLEENGAQVSVLTHDGGHATTPEVVASLGRWLAGVLGSAP